MEERKSRREVPGLSFAINIEFMLKHSQFLFIGKQIASNI